VRSKQERPHWGAPKIRERLARLYPDIHTPAISTVHAVLDRHGLVKRRGRRRNKATGTPLSTSDQPNDLWCADYKGEFMLADRRYCYPLTITDFASRYLIACEALQSTREAYAGHFALRSHCNNLRGLRSIVAFVVWGYPMSNCALSDRLRRDHRPNMHTELRNRLQLQNFS
jgi:transposase InsO family protein